MTSRYVLTAPGRVLNHYGSHGLAVAAKKRVDHLQVPTAIVEIDDAVRLTEELALYGAALHNSFFLAQQLAIYSTQVEPRVYGHKFFVTGETIDGELRWTVRSFRIRFSESSALMSVNTAEGYNFRQFKSFRAASNEADRMGKLALKRNERGVTF